MDAARVWKLARKRNVAREVEIRDVGRSVEAFDLVERYGLKILFTFRMFLERGLESLLLPALALYLSR